MMNKDKIIKYLEELIHHLEWLGKKEDKIKDIETLIEELNNGS